MPPDAMIGATVVGEEPRVQAQVRAVEQAVAFDRRHLEGVDAHVGETFDRRRNLDAGRPGDPALADGEAVADIDRDRHPVGAVALDQPPDEGRIGECRRPDDCAPGTRCQDCCDRLLVPEAARDLDSCPVPDCRDDRLDLSAVGRLAGPCAVEVYHMQPSSSRLDEPGRDRRRIRCIDRLAREVALLQPHDVTTAQIDRRQDLEGHCHHHVIMLS